MTEPLDPQVIRGGLPEQIEADIDSVVEQINKELNEKGRVCIARNGHISIGFDYHESPGWKFAAIWENHHAVIVERFQKAGWFVRYVGRQPYSRPAFHAYAFALDLEKLPEYDPGAAEMEVDQRPAPFWRTLLRGRA